MEQRQFGSTARAVAAIGQGTWNMEKSPKSAVAALRRGFDLGMTHVDTAELYGTGVAETLVGEAIAGRRDELFIVSKVVPQNASRRGTVEACEKSLARLGTDRLDCYLLHWRGPHPLADTVAAFEQLRSEGKVLSWGVSNFDLSDLEELRGVTDTRPVCNQVFYHLGERNIEHAVIALCVKEDIAIVAYSPFGQGDFPGPRSAGGAVLAKIAAAHDATPRQVALRFLLRHPSVFAIPKAANAEHVADNAGADALQLDKRELAAIDKAFPLGPRRRNIAAF